MGSTYVKHSFTAAFGVEAFMDFYAFKVYTLIARKIRFSLTMPLIKINHMEDVGSPKSQGLGQLPLLSCPSAGGDCNTIIRLRYRNALCGFRNLYYYEFSKN